MAVKDCPDRRQLAAYARGELPAIDAQLIQAALGVLCGLPGHFAELGRPAGGDTNRRRAGPGSTMAPWLCGREDEAECFALGRFRFQTSTPYGV